ncbi:MAG TPA: phosphoglycerate kinase [Opitutales bacterium]|nr:phosphoglycerate kinase [Opitutales bacterium]
MPRTKTVNDVNLAGQRVFVRVDFNVPFDEKGNVSDDTRVVESLPTIKHLMAQGAKVILASHLGRPKGKRDPKQSLRPVLAVLEKHLGKTVAFADDCIGAEAEQKAAALKNGEVLLLENVRFHAAEEKNDPAFAKQLAQLAQVFVNDAFGSAHRAHASTAGIAAHLPMRVAGLLMQKELTFLGEKTAAPARPFCVILGGAKVSDKIKVIDALLDKADAMIIGGAMAYTFALANGKKVGQSLTEPDKVELAKQAQEKAKRRGVKLLLPVDNLITDKLDFPNAQVGATQVVSGDIPDGWEGVDIGPQSIALFSAEIARAKTILWNGPMGVFEIKACAQGTFAVAKAIAENSGAVSIIGGGDSVKAVKKSGQAGKVTFISTGGGASLEFLEGQELPGVACLETV